MGGFGSGRESFRATVEDSLVLNGYRLLAVGGARNNGDFSKTGVWGWSANGKQIASIKYVMHNANILLSYLHNNEPVKTLVYLDHTEQPNGGVRYWFICPGRNCSRRVAKLYLPGGAKTFACRNCYKLTYTSCKDSHKSDMLLGMIAARIGVSLETAKRLIKG